MKRVRTVFSTSEIPHLWIHQRVKEARNQQSNFYFHGKVIYSYGAHFPVARIMNRGGHKIVLITTLSYGPTTGGHIRAAQDAIPKAIPKFYVEKVMARNVLQQLLRRTHEMWELVRSKRDKQGSIGLWRQYRRSAIEFAKLGGQTINPLIPSDYGEQYRLGLRFSRHRRAKWEKERIEREKREREQARLDRIHFKKHLPAWLKGKYSTNRLQAWRQSNIYLRLVRRRTCIETSKGAIVPIADAKRLWQFSNFCRRAKMSFVGGEGPDLMIGGYGIQTIDPNGNVQIGCHELTWAMMSRMARFLGVANETADPRAASAIAQSATE